MATKLAFTTLREDGHYPLFWSQHWQRLQRSWRYYHASDLTGEKELLQRVRDHFAISSQQVVRIDLLANETQPLFELSARALSDHGREPKLCLAKDYLVSRKIPTWLKAGDYTERLDKRRECQELGCHEVLYFDQHGYVAEATVSNILWSKGRTLYAPAENAAFLQGITTRMIQALAQDQGLKVENEQYGLSHLLEAEAAWLVNAVTGPLRVKAIEGHHFAAISPQADVDQLYWQLVSMDREKRSE